MPSSTSQSTTIRLLTFALVSAILYLFLVPSSGKAPSESNAVSDPADSYDASRFAFDASFLKSAGEKISNAVSGKQSSQNDDAEDEWSRKEEADPEEAIAQEEPNADEALTDEEQAVKDYHERLGEDQSMRDRPKAPKPDTGNANPSNSSAASTPLFTEVVIPEIKHYTQINNADKAKQLILSITHDEHHWGRVGGIQRTFDGFIEFINETSGLELETVSMAILTASETAYQSYISTMVKYPFAKFQVILYEPKEYVKEPADRHDPSYQPVRRKQIAIARNLLMLRALGQEEHIFWYDSDVIGADKGIAAKMLEHSANGGRTLPANEDIVPSKPLPLGLLTARCVEDSNPDYDLNAWGHKGSDRGAARTTPNAEEQAKRKEGEHWESSSDSAAMQMAALTKLTTNDEVFPLDSVGGVLLYIRADLVRMGLTFPFYYVVGTTWDTNNGYDGIETEGICFVAQQLGYGCYGLGGDWHVNHQH